MSNLKAELCEEIEGYLNSMTRLTLYPILHKLNVKDLTELVIALGKMKQDIITQFKDEQHD